MAGRGALLAEIESFRGDYRDRLRPTHAADENRPRGGGPRNTTLGRESLLASIRSHGGRRAPRASENVPPAGEEAPRPARRAPRAPHGDVDRGAIIAAHGAGRLAKYARGLRAGLPVGAVAQMLQRDGVSARDCEAFWASGGGGGGGGVPTPAAGRARPAGRLPKPTPVGLAGMVPRPGPTRGVPPRPAGIVGRFPAPRSPRAPVRASTGPPPRPQMGRSGPQRAPGLEIDRMAILRAFSEGPMAKYANALVRGVSHGAVAQMMRRDRVNPDDLKSFWAAGSDAASRAPERRGSGPGSPRGLRSPRGPGAERAAFNVALAKSVGEARTLLDMTSALDAVEGHCEELMAAARVDLASVDAGKEALIAVAKGVLADPERRPLWSEFAAKCFGSILTMCDELLQG